MAGQFVVNVEAAVHRDGQWLVIERSAKEQHAGGMLALPGGTLEESDTSGGAFEACVRREVWEEVGITLGPRLEYVESKLFYSARGRWVVNVVFLAPHGSGEPTAKSPDEVAWTGWRRLADVLGDPRCPVWLAESMRSAERRLADAGRTERED
ncbi:MAG: NUDIX domain-containing protein [Streptomyces sp.]|nr:NUDIX domain-containing protein [Streptomyces sp.]NUS15320.1 NUDIX domain-containing protein [Streptomyces sp.]